MHQAVTATTIPKAIGGKSMLHSSNSSRKLVCRPRGARRGAAVTEFAIVAPVFFLMVIGFLEFGRALMVQQVLINASRVGARQASTTAATTAEGQSAVEDYTAG